jgi:hypothetical protein
MTQLREKFFTAFCFEFGIPEKLVRLIKMCLNETFDKIRVGKCLFNAFPI